MGRSSFPTRAAPALALLGSGYLLIQFLAAAPASPLVPPLPRGATVPGWAAAGARWLGLDGLRHGVLTVLVIAVLAGLVAAFLLVALEAWQGRVRPGVLALVICGSIALSVAGPLVLSRDVHSYATYGRMYALYGANPFEVSPSAFPDDPFTAVVSEEWIDTRSVYGPAFTLVSAGIARAASSPGAAILGFKVLAGVALAATVLLAALATRAVRPGREVFAAAVVGLNPVLVVHTVGGGHNDALVAVLLAGAAFVAVRLRRSGGTEDREPAPLGSWRKLLVTVLVTLAALVKVPAGLALLMWLWFLARSRRGQATTARAIALHLGAAVVVLVAVAGPFLTGWRTLTAITKLVSIEGWASGPRLVARGMEAVGRAAAGSTAASVLSELVYIVFLLAVAVVIWRFLTRSLEDPAAAPAAWGVALLVFALASPNLLPWYVAWFVPMLPLLADRFLIWVGLGMAGLLALTGVPAEPRPDPGLFDSMVLAVHYVAGPVVLGLFLLTAARLWRQRAPVGVEAAPVGGAPDGQAPSAAETTVTSRFPNARA